MSLVFSNTTFAQMFVRSLTETSSESAILLGGAHLGCRESESDSKNSDSKELVHVHATVRHRIQKAQVKVHPSAPTVVIIEDGRRVPIEQVFKHARVSMSRPSMLVTQEGNGKNNSTNRKLSSCPDSCGQCVRAGGGNGCKDRCSPCGSDCLTCLEYGGGQACDSRCNSPADEDHCNIALIATGKCTTDLNDHYNFNGIGLNYDGKNL